ncbi:hypothetical protein [Streptomyces sp. NBC_01589]|uniref:hypothetical protein n=1 Tax=unclassified Streptomyces TaxID=2593676 RepID=UPI00386D03BF
MRRGTASWVAVDDVPKGEKFYQVEVPHRGKAQLGGLEAEDGKLAQTSPHDWAPDLMARGPTAAAAICRAAADERMTL